MNKTLGGGVVILGFLWGGKMLCMSVLLAPVCDAQGFTTLVMYDS